MANQSMPIAEGHWTAAVAVLDCCIVITCSVFQTLQAYDMACTVTIASNQVKVGYLTKVPCLLWCRYDKEGEPTFASARLWDDGVIDPADTRRVLGLSLAASLNAPLSRSHYGVFRM